VRGVAILHVARAIKHSQWWNHDGGRHECDPVPDLSMAIAIVVRGRRGRTRRYGGTRPRIITIGWSSTEPVPGDETPFGFVHHRPE